MKTYSLVNASLLAIASLHVSTSNVELRFFRLSVGIDFLHCNTEHCRHFILNPYLEIWKKKQ